MVNTIDMQDLRQLNLFEKITNIRTRFVFEYNDTLIFCVPKQFISKAIGPEARNIRRMNEILKKKIKVIASPNGIEDAKKFVEAIVSPVTFKELEVKEDEIIITAGNQSKAALIGRNKRRMIEMQKVIKDFFSKNLKII